MASIPRRIVLTGSESTGKTTLAQGVAQHLGTAWVAEFARGYAEARGGILTAADVEPIARGQFEAETAAMAGPGLVVFDTDLVSTAVYARHYYGEVPAWVEPAIRRLPSSLYLLCDIDLPWVSDGVRDRPADRTAMHERFEDALRAFGIEPLIIRGSGPARLDRAIEAVNQWREQR